VILYVHGGGWIPATPAPATDWVREPARCESHRRRERRAARQGRGLRPQAHEGRRADDDRPLNATLHGSRSLQSRMAEHAKATVGEVAASHRWHLPKLRSRRRRSEPPPEAGAGSLGASRDVRQFRRLELVSLHKRAATRQQNSERKLMSIGGLNV
jgi:hypothetical protein